jgi:hypothetical protein
MHETQIFLQMYQTYNIKVVDHTIQWDEVYKSTRHTGSTTRYYVPPLIYRLCHQKNQSGKVDFFAVCPERLI